MCNSTNVWSDCYCQKNECNKKIILTETDRLKDTRDNLTLLLIPRQKEAIKNETQVIRIITGTVPGKY